MSFPQGVLGIPCGKLGIGVFCMGAWGTAIYSCDIAEDVRDACNEIFAFFDIEEGNNRLFLTFSDVIKQDFIDNEYASFWYALSDWQWKHGMLNVNIKEKTLSLLEKYAGLDEWGHKDISKRRKILDRLKEQLTQPQPVLKKPRAKVCKPKHVPGDVIVFRAAIEHDIGICTKWRIESFVPPLFFKSTKFRDSQYENIDGYDASGKWMALLCVGSVKENFSEYIDDVFDEYSLYVWYDYLSSEQPSVDDLSMCGFLPYINWKWKDFNRNITESVNWGYEFTVVCEKFKKSHEIESVTVVSRLGEVGRYKQLVSQRNYSTDYYGGFTVADMFSTVFSEKNRATILGEKYDNLLNRDVRAPQLLASKEVDINLQKYIRNND